VIFSEYIFNAFSFSSSVKGLSLYDDMLIDSRGVGVCTGYEIVLIGYSAVWIGYEVV
jgi:hypothetical protein